MFFYIYRAPAQIKKAGHNSKNICILKYINRKDNRLKGALYNDNWDKQKMVSM